MTEEKKHPYSHLKVELEKFEERTKEIDNSNTVEFMIKTILEKLQKVTVDDFVTRSEVILEYYVVPGRVSFSLENDEFWSLVRQRVNRELRGSGVHVTLNGNYANSGSKFYLHVFIKSD